MNATQRATQWAQEACFDTETQLEAQRILADPQALLACFGEELAFGTGGLRGILGVGTARMNPYTVAKATRGLADYLKATGGKAVAIAYDSRLYSQAFAGITAGVLSARGITAHVFSRLMPTPVLSYAVRALGCDAGIMVTASHNPAVYNGYKVYGADGCQITDGVAAALAQAIAEVNYTDLHWLGESEAREAGLWQDVPETVLETYLAKTLACRVAPQDTPIKVVYTPLHGTGLEPVRRVLSQMPGVLCLEVSAQCTPDGHFPTCPKPNPELSEALALAIALAKESRADLVIATDPDCDRVGVVVRQGEGDYPILTGNQVGLLLQDYVLSHPKVGRGAIPLVVKTIVTSDLAFPIAQAHGAQVMEVLTGFKYIGEVIGRLEAAGEADRYALGFEESCGYLAGTHVRDKDGVMACMLVVEMAQAWAARGKTLVQAMEQLYRTHGYMETRLLNFDIGGALPMEKMKAVMTKLRANPPVQLGDAPISCVKDYLLGIGDLPVSDVLSFENEMGAKAIVRPSGTEPKVKVYLSAKGQSAQQAQQALDTMAGQVEMWLA